MTAGLDRIEMRAHHHHRLGRHLPWQSAAQISGPVVIHGESDFTRRAGQYVRSGLIRGAPRRPGDANTVLARSTNFIEQFSRHCGAAGHRGGERRHVDTAHGANTSIISS